MGVVELRISLKNSQFPSFEMIELSTEVVFVLCCCCCEFVASSICCLQALGLRS